MLISGFNIAPKPLNALLVPVTLRRLLAVSSHLHSLRSLSYLTQIHQEDNHQQRAAKGLMP
jgi:hypothetical protein